MTEKLQETALSVLIRDADVIAKEALSPQFCLSKLKKKTLSVDPANARTLDLPHGGDGCLNSNMYYRLCGLIVRVRVVPRRTVVGDIDRRFDNLSGSHHQSHVNCITSVYGIYVSGQLSRDVVGCFKSNRW